jgi:hypothetical protein
MWLPEHESEIDGVSLRVSAKKNLLIGEARKRDAERSTLARFNTLPTAQVDASAATFLSRVWHACSAVLDRRPPCVALRGGDCCPIREDIFSGSLFFCGCSITTMSQRSTTRSRTTPILWSVTMKRILSALIASVTLMAAVSSVAQAATPRQCEGPASYCNIFFGQ